MSWVWTFWIVFILASFALIEGHAVATGKVTLSEYIHNGAKAWPLLPAVVGLIVGGLFVHFFWPSCY